MPRKKKLIAESDLVPMPEFEEVIKKVLTASKDEVYQKMAEFQSSNKARRETQKLTKCEK